MKPGMHSTAGRARQYRILLFPQGTGVEHIGRMLVIGEALRSRGHEVVFACPGPYARSAGDAGFDTRQIDYEPPQLLLPNTIKQRRSADAVDRITRLVDREVGLISRVEPDCVVGDLRLTLGLSCELTNTPHIAVVNARWTRHSAAADTLPFLPSRSPAGPFRFLSGLPCFSKSIASIEPFDGFCDARGLHQRQSIHSLVESNVLNLVMDAPAISPMLDAPSHYSYVGPGLWEAPAEAPAWLERLRDDVPVVYIATSAAAFGDHFQTVLAALSSGKAQVLASTDGADPPAGLPPNCFVDRFLPASKAAELSDLVVCNGSETAIYRALSAGTPVLGIPGTTEQRMNMERLTELGAGVILTPRKATTARIADTVSELLTRPAYRTRAAELSSCVTDFDTPAEAADLIEKVLDDRIDRRDHADIAASTSSTVTEATSPEAEEITTPS